MNKSLEEEIVNHILKNFGFNNKLIHNYLIDNNHLLMSDMDLFEDNEYKSPLWGLSATISDIKFNIFHGMICDVDGNISIIIVNIDNLPTYGIYDGEEKLIYCKTLESDWMKCSTYLQGTFLAGMEQVKELGIVYDTANIHDFDMQSFKNLLRIIDAREN